MLVVPIAFVSEHGETLVELDIEYRDLAHEAGVPGYFRAPAPNSDPGFIAALATLVRRARGVRSRHVQPCRRPHLSAAAPRVPVRTGGSRASGGGSVTALELMRRRTRRLGLVIFDCDGVLVDSERLNNAVVAAELSAAGWPMTAAEAEQRFIGMTFDRHGPADRGAGSGGRLPQSWKDGLEARLVAACWPKRWSRCRARWRRWPGSTALGLPWRVASNSSHEEMEAKFGPDRPPDDARRPGAQPPRRGARQAGARPVPGRRRGRGGRAGECLVVEDSGPGARAAVAAGMDCLGYAPHSDGAAARARRGAVPLDVRSAGCLLAARAGRRAP